MKQKSSDNLTVYYGLVQWTYWLGNAVLGAFASKFLLTIGLTNTRLSLLLALCGLLAAISSPLLGSLIDRKPTLSTAHLLYAFGAGLMAVGVLILCFPYDATLLMAVLFGIGYVFVQILQPFINALGVECINQGYQISFGFSRASGAFGYAISAFLTGILVDRIGIVTIPVATIITYSGMVLTVAFLRKKKNANPACGTPKKSANLNPIRFLKRYPTYAGLLAGMILIYFSHGFVNTFCLQILETKGGTSTSVGISTAVAAVFEIVPMLCAPFLLKHFRLGNLLRFSGIFYTVKSLGSLLAPNVYAYYAVQFFQLPAWGIMAISIVFYVNETVDHEHSSQGQAFAGMTLTVGNLLCTLICGILIDNIGINRTLIIATIVCAVGACIIFLTTGKQRKVTEDMPQ